MAVANETNQAWARRLTWLALALSVGGLVVAAIAAVGSGQGMWDFRAGFAVLRYAFYTAIAGGLIAIVAGLMARRAGEPDLARRNLVALLIALAFILYLGVHIVTARSVPAIHDVTTNLADVPQFSTLEVRADNLDNIPDEGRPELAALAPEARWKALHAEGYGDLRTVRVRGGVAATIARAETIARKRGWTIAHVDPQAGILEATDTSLFFRFKDDVVLRARPAAHGATQVDMRSISRVGGSDIGVNAKRIRAFLKDLR